jgi:AAA+ superfamily predicted ATPase
MMSFGDFDIYYDKANQALKSGDLITAKRCFYLASRSLLEVALVHEDEDVKNALSQRAQIVEDRADALPLPTSITSLSTPSISSSKKHQPFAASTSKQSNDEDSEDEMNFLPVTVPSIKFDDVAGLDDVKEAIRRRIINPMQHPEMYERFKKETGGGVLMYGPPGTGKTMIAKAIAHEVNAKFYSIRCSDILSKWVGDSEKNIKELFAQARSEKTAVVFFDEFDSLAVNRSTESTVMSRAVNELLSQIDGFSESKTMLLLLAATNRPWEIDSGITRSRRFSEKLYIPLPDVVARKNILKMCFSGVPIEDSIDYDDLAIRTEGFSGADVAEFCNRSKDFVLDRCIQIEESGGNSEDEKITRDDIYSTLEQFSSTVNTDDIRKLEEFRVKYDNKNVKKKAIEPYIVPVDGLLKQYPEEEYGDTDETNKAVALSIKEKLNEFNIQVEITGIQKGPTYTTFEVLPAQGIKISKIEGLADDIALRLAAVSVRIARIPGKEAVGIEVPNSKRSIVFFKEIIERELSREGEKLEIPVGLGKDISGEVVTIDLIEMPHLLIAGATDSGKSVCVNSLILSILYQKTPVQCRLILIDPKIVELNLYNGIPHLLAPVITEPKKAFQALQYCILEMEQRFSCLDRMKVRDIKSYNQQIKEHNLDIECMPYIVVVIDEFADLVATTGKELENILARLAAKSRSVGIHLVLATQRPTVDVITGVIKANITSRIAFMVASKTDSQTIIGNVGAEKLLGKGDMIYAGKGVTTPIRMQGALVSGEEVKRVVNHVKTLGEPNYIDEKIFSK